MDVRSNLRADDYHYYHYYYSCGSISNHNNHNTTINTNNEHVIIIIIIVIVLIKSDPTSEPQHAVSPAANLPTKTLDFRGFDSSRILSLRGGVLMSIGIFLGIKS